MGADHMGETSFDHDVTLVVAGDAESLRARLADALERIGYRVLIENPIQARQGATDLAKNGCSQDILDYRRSLDIGLKSAGANSTRVTFAYTVKGVWLGYLTKGDRNTLTREAEAIVALAQSRAALSYCPACGSDGAGAARFCRQCGAPVASADPPELDLLRLSAAANASFKNIATGALFAMIGLVAPALLFLKIFLSPDHGGLDAKLFKLMAVLLVTFGALGLGFLIPGLWRLGRAIKHRPGREDLPSPSRRNFVEGANPPAAALPPQSIQHPVQHSVTEATTGLLPQEVKRTNDLN